jgi:hypothetical protein
LTRAPWGSYGYGRRIPGLYGLKGRVTLDEPQRTAGTPADPLYDRNQAIVALSGAGWDHSRIARLFGIVTPRVDQIVTKERSARMARGDPREW